MAKRARCRLRILASYHPGAVAPESGGAASGAARNSADVSGMLMRHLHRSGGLPHLLADQAAERPQGFLSRRRGELLPEEGQPIGATLRGAMRGGIGASVIRAMVLLRGPVLGAAGTTRPGGAVPIGRLSVSVGKIGKA